MKKALHEETSIDDYVCGHCKGKARITVLEDGEKATEPLIEFCPFCGMSIGYSGKIDYDD